MHISSSTSNSNHYIQPYIHYYSAKNSICSISCTVQRNWALNSFPWRKPQFLLSGMFMLCCSVFWKKWFYWTSNVECCNADILHSRETAQGMKVIASGSIGVYVQNENIQLSCLSMSSATPGSLIGFLKRGWINCLCSALTKLCGFLNWMQCSDVFGDTIVVGDTRCAGSFGIDADFIANEKCCVAHISAKHLMVIVMSDPIFIRNYLGIFLHWHGVV